MGWRMKTSSSRVRMISGAILAILLASGAHAGAEEPVAITVPETPGEPALVVDPIQKMEQGYLLLQQGRLMGADDPNDDAIGTCLLLDSLRPAFAGAQQFCDDTATALLLESAKSLEKEDLANAEMAVGLASELTTNPALKQRIKQTAQGLDVMNKRLGMLPK